MENVVWFKDVDKGDVAEVGGKGANLGELTKIGAPVPDGFIVTSQAYFEAVKNSGVLDRIKGILYGVDSTNFQSLDQKARACQEQIKKIKLDQNLKRDIFSFYEKLPGKNPLVAVRSSATAEDLPQASFAGQQATFLNIKGQKALIEAILDAWASLFEARAIFYRITNNFDHFKVGIAVPVQIMVQSQTSGIMFTQDPVTNDKTTITIEAVFGLGELIVSGQITPDHYEVKKNDFEIKLKTIKKQEKQLVYSKPKNKMLAVSKAFQNAQKLPDEKIVELAKLGALLEKHYFFPQDVEWAYENGKLFLVQTRPITTIATTKKSLEGQVEYKTPKRDALVIGAPASPVIATGRVIVVQSPKELFKVKTGDVLVCEMTNPDYVIAMKKAVAVVTDKGGRTSHAAIVSRELGIACVVGTGNATKKLKTGEVVTVDGTKGEVYKGSILQAKKDLKLQDRPIPKQISKKTATKLYVNASEPDMAPQVAAQNVDGVGLLRAEFMLAQIGTHPKKFIAEGREDEFVEALSKGMSAFGKAFDKRPVIYRSSDFKSNEYRNLKGGDLYEPKEPNPMLGYRGALRYIKDPDTFKLELKALQKAREKHPNLHLMIPFVRSPKELEIVKKMIDNTDLAQDSSFKLWMMVELPTNVIQLEKYLEIGIDGVSIGSNDLTMLILGTDRDNTEVSSEFDEMDPAVLWALEHTIKTCAKYNVTASICGQAPSVYPELTQKLVHWGITSISVNPDRIEETRQIIYQAENNLVSKDK